MSKEWMRRVSACVVCGMLAVSMYAAPAYSGWQTKILSDGSQITVRLMGDEFYHYWETTDGKIAKEQANGTFVLTDEAKPDRQTFMARRKASAMYRSKPRKATGDHNLAPKGLVILVQFQDVSFQEANNNEAFHDMLNKEGYSYDGATGSAVDYFKAQSNNTYAPEFDVFGPVTLPHDRVYYGEQGEIDGETENDLYIADFVTDAVDAAAEAGCDFSLYDSDDDGFVDIVYFFYADKGQAAGGSTETIWPHNWSLVGALYWGRTHGTSGYFVEADEDGYITDYNLPYYNGKIINDYVCSAELKYSGQRSGIGTLCHEFSHVLGLPDYYDTQYGDNYKNSVTPAQWSIMDQGSYNNDEMTPPNYSIFDKYYMGWATPKFLAKGEKKDVSMTTGYDDAYQITGGNKLVGYDNTETVYYIENRQKTGWDAYLPGHGMLIWKVRYDAAVWTANATNDTAGDPRYTVVSASGSTQIGDVWQEMEDHWELVHDGQTDPFPGTSEVTDYTPATGCEITEIAESGGVITFKYNGGEASTDVTNTIAEQVAVKALMNGQIMIIRDGKTFDILGNSIQ